MENCGNCYCKKMDFVKGERIYYCRVKGAIIEDLNLRCDDYTKPIYDPIPTKNPIKVQSTEISIIERRNEIIEKIQELINELKTLEQDNL